MFCKNFINIEIYYSVLRVIVQDVLWYYIYRLFYRKECHMVIKDTRVAMFRGEVNHSLSVNEIGRKRNYNKLKFMLMTLVRIVYTLLFTTAGIMKRSRLCEKYNFSHARFVFMRT